VWDEAGTWRVIYTARMRDTVYVLHAFGKKSQATPTRDIELAAQRHAQLIRGRQ
jgi:phage-related protein